MKRIRGITGIENAEFLEIILKLLSKNKHKACLLSLINCG